MGKFVARITPAAEQDYEEVCELFSKLDQHHAEVVPDRFRSRSGNARSLERYLAYISGDDRVLFLAKNEALCVGFANLAIVEAPENGIHVARSYAHLDNMYVLPQHRNAGVAASLLAASVEWCKQKRIPILELQVYNANVDALRFYKAQGFSEYLTKMELQVDE
jgi:GNAT superfamily N-acetyltransferase